MSEPRTVELPPLSIRAEVGDVNESTRTVPLIFSTGAPVVRMDWWTGKRYIETLSLKPSAVRMERLNAGAPLLDAHSAYSVGDILGAVEPGSARLEKGQATANVRFSKRDAVEPIYQDVKDRIITSVSVGYRVYKFIETPGKDENALPTREAVDWEPYEISLVPMPADTGARVRNGDTNPHSNPCVIETRSTGEAMAEERQQAEFVVEPNPIPPAQQEQRTEQVVEPNAADASRAAERERVQGILTAVRAARLPQSKADKMIADGIDLVRAQSEVFAELEKREMQANGPKPGSGPSAHVGDDPLVHARAGIENALLHRIAPQHFKLEDSGRHYRALSLLDIAKIFIAARGMRTTDMTKNDVAGAALGLTVRAGMHTTSDFALLLEDVARKTLRQEYAAAPQTFATIARRVTLPDYKPSRRLQIGEAPALQEVQEHGEYTYGTIGEGRETMQLAKFGRKFAITREAIINDDLDAFSRIPQKFGRAARNLESNMVWFEILSNPTMGDGIALFHASHGNLDNVGDAIGVESIGLGRAAMRLQTALDSDGVTYIDATPRYLIVPPSLETEADKFVSTNMLANQGSDVNPFGGRLTVISEPRLENGVTVRGVTAAGSAIAWYLSAAAADGLDLIEYAYLAGEEGPVLETRQGWDVDGIEFKCRLDFAAKVIDHRGFYKNHGDQSAT